MQCVVCQGGGTLPHRWGAALRPREFPEIAKRMVEEGAPVTIAYDHNQTVGKVVDAWVAPDDGSLWVRADVWDMKAVEKAARGGGATMMGYGYSAPDIIEHELYIEVVRPFKAMYLGFAHNTLLPGGGEVRWI